MKIYKFLRKDMKSGPRGSEIQWKLGEKYIVPPIKKSKNLQALKNNKWKPKFGDEGVLFCFKDINLAALTYKAYLNVHDLPGDNKKDHLDVYEGEIYDEVLSDGIGCGSYEMVLYKKIELHKYTLDQRIKFNIELDKLEDNTSEWKKWESDWSSGIDRSLARARTVGAFYAMYNDDRHTYGLANVMAQEMIELGKSPEYVYHLYKNIIDKL